MYKLIAVECSTPECNTVNEVPLKRRKKTKEWNEEAHLTGKLFHSNDVQPTVFFCHIFDAKGKTTAKIANIRHFSNPKMGERSLFSCKTLEKMK